MEDHLTERQRPGRSHRGRPTSVYWSASCVPAQLDLLPDRRPLVVPSGPSAGAGRKPLVAFIFKLWCIIYALYARPALHRPFSFLATRLRAPSPKRQSSRTRRRLPLVPARRRLHEPVRERKSVQPAFQHQHQEGDPK